MSDNEMKKTTTSEQLANERRRALFHPFLDLFDDAFFGDDEEDVMRTDVRDCGDHWVLEMEIPGVDKKDIKISLNKGYLSITVPFNRTQSDEDQNERYIHYERVMGTYNRSFFVGQNINKSDITASSKNGLLTLTIPKKGEPAEEDRYIPID